MVLVTSESEVTEVDDTERIPLLMDREGFTGPVNREIGPLPEGVELVEKELVVGPDTRRFVFSLSVTPEAKPARDFPLVIKANAANLPAVTETL